MHVIKLTNVQNFAFYNITFSYRNRFELICKAENKNWNFCYSCKFLFNFNYLLLSSSRRILNKLFFFE